jgi:hypothetical protein
VYAVKCPITRSAVTAHRTASGRLRSAGAMEAGQASAPAWSAGRGGIVILSPAALATAAAPTTAIAMRQPVSWPRAVVSGTPSTRASELPANTVAVARPAFPGGASLAATGASTDQNTPWASAHSRRAASSTA